MTDRPSVLVIALVLLVSACTDTRKSTPIVGTPFSIRSAGTFTPDSHVYQALYYGNRELTEDIGAYSSGPDPEILLYEKKKLYASGLYVFDGHKGTDTNIHDVVAETYTDSTGRQWSSDAVFFPMRYDNVHWSPDAAYIVLEDSDRRRLQIIDVARARVVAPGWLVPTEKTSFTAWDTNRTFTVDIFSKGKFEPLRVRVDPLQIQTKSGDTIWPSQ